MAEIGPTGVNASAKEVVIVMGAGVGCIVLLYWLSKREVKDAAKTVGNAVAPVVNAVNPASSTNIIQKILDAPVKLADKKAAANNTGFSTWLVDWMNPSGINDYDPNAETPRG